MPFSGKLPSRQAIDKAVIIHGQRIKSTPAEFACAVFETATRIEELEEMERLEKKPESEELDRPAAEGRGDAGNSSRPTHTS
jgi:DNA-binding transcriptional regulator of glucitol operon